MRILSLFFFTNLAIFTFSQGTNFNGEKISFPSLDSITITADLYTLEESDSTYIILCHQAMFSRGSYREIAPKLNNLGYNCIAIDQRAGYKAQGVKNETNKRAKKKKLDTKYLDAIQDIEAAILYTKNELKAKKIILWGSSYSASIVLYLSSKYPDDITAVLSFSPGEYFTIEENTIEFYMDKITCPVFITSAKNEEKNWKAIFEAIHSIKTSFLPSKGGNHGSKALWEEKSEHEEYWEAVESFLKVI